MEYLGEIISLTVAVSWTATALFADIASHRIGAMPLNIIRMGLSIILLAIFLFVLTGAPYPLYANNQAWFWLGLSGVVGYIFGDYCLFNCYVLIGSKFGQLFMTLAPPVAGIAGWIMLGQQMKGVSWLAMAVTLCGIAISILAKDKGSKKVKLKLPVRGVLLGIGAGIGQGIGLVLSKIGLDHYASVLPADASSELLFAVPFAGTMIRAIFGFIGFFAIISLMHSNSKVVAALRDRKGMTFASLTTIFGPFVGVSLSLMAVQYAKAGIASTLMALTPVLIIVPYAIINKQKISLKEVTGTLVTLTGVAMFFLL